MVDYLGWRVSSSLQTLLAQRMSRSVSPTDFSPLGIIPLGCFRVAVEVVIALGLQFGMFLAEPAIGQPGAAGVGAGMLGFSGHISALLFLTHILTRVCHYDSIRKQTLKAIEHFKF